MGIIINSMGGFRVGDTAVSGEQSVTIVSFYQNGDAAVIDGCGQVSITRVELLSKPKKGLAQLLVGTDGRAEKSLKALI